MGEKKGFDLIKLINQEPHASIPESVLIKKTKMSPQQLDIYLNNLSALGLLTRDKDYVTLTSYGREMR